MTKVHLFALLCAVVTVTARGAEPPRPNIVWLVSEDHGQHMGCYGARYADTPHVDGLAARGLRYANVWSNAPVCAPARTTLISGMYANSLGAEHMRSMVPYPAGKQMYPQLLREAGYYCTNNAKEDYNLQQPGQVWDESSNRAHWRNRPQGKPFFAVFNSNKSHEGKIRDDAELVHDPAQAPVPAYHPDTPEVRRDWARYYDTVTAADADAGARLRELDEAGLSDSTIVFYYADHGSGMPRSKRWPYDSGLRVPLVVYIPEKFAHLRPPEYEAGAMSPRLVSFVDFAPTLLSLAGIEPPDWMQGRAFLGVHLAPAPDYLFGFRGRMDERYDLVRSVTDGRYVYVRNYMPQRIYGQYLSYMFQTRTTQVWRQLHEEGKLSAEQDAFWNTKPADELYDLASDPDEVRNLADSPQHAEVRARLSDALRVWILEIRDVGFLPEGEIHKRAAGLSPYDFVRDSNRYPLERILAAAEVASDGSAEATAALQTACDDADNAVRYWGVSGFLMRGAPGVTAGHQQLRAALEDDSPYIRVVAAEALARYPAEDGDRARGLAVLSEAADWSAGNVFLAIAALNSLDAVGEAAHAERARLRAAAEPGSVPHARYRDYVPRLLRNERDQE